MNLTQQKEIEELNAHLVENWQANTTEVEELFGAQKELGLTFDDRATCPFLRPHFVGRELYEEIVDAAQKIALAEETLTHAALENDELLEFLDLTPAEKRLAKIEPGYAKVCNSSRFDTFIGNEGFKFLEYNAETPAGVGDQKPLETVLGMIPEVRKFLAENEHWCPKPHQKLLGSLFASYREFGGKKSKPNIAIIDWEGVSTGSEFEILRDYFESNGFRTLIVDPSEVEYDGKMLRAGTFEIDILYKRVLIHEFLERCATDHPLLKAYEDGNLCMCNSFRVKIPHKKASFAILSDEKYAAMFTAQELDAIKKHIPWTRKVMECETEYDGTKVELTKFLRAERETLLMKPNDDYGGKGIVLGWEATESEWDAAIAEALDDSFIVQKRAPIQKHTFPVIAEKIKLEELLVDFDPFLFQNKVEGGMVRLSASSLVNVTQGGGQTALVVLE